MSRIEDAVIRKIKDRAEMGLNRYGMTMERQDLNLMDWLTHAQQEAMDLAIYLQRIMEETKAKESCDEISKAESESLSSRPCEYCECNEATVLLVRKSTASDPKGPNRRVCVHCSLHVLDHEFDQELLPTK